MSCWSEDLASAVAERLSAATLLGTFAAVNAFFRRIASERLGRVLPNVFRRLPRICVSAGKRNPGPKRCACFAKWYATRCSSRFVVPRFRHARAQQQIRSAAFLKTLSHAQCDCHTTLTAPVHALVNAQHYFFVVSGPTPDSRATAADWAEFAIANASKLFRAVRRNLEAPSLYKTVEFREPTTKAVRAWLADVGLAELFPPTEVRVATKKRPVGGWKKSRPPLKRIRPNPTATGS